MQPFDLLSKTELRIDGVILQDANLTDVAAQVARTLGLAATDVLVVDCRGETMVIDVLNSCVNAHQIVGKKERLLKEIGKIPGVAVSSRTTFSSNGMLGWIALDEAQAIDGLRRSRHMASDIVDTIRTRIMVFPTGQELLNRQITDTNSPLIKSSLEALGYKISISPPLPDNASAIESAIRDAVDSGGYGGVITTGGVGAEDKDHTVEAILSIDPRAATPYICHYEIGTGRHVKDGVRIGVGEYHGARIIALPGPNDEVAAALTPLTIGLTEGGDKRIVAEMIASRLRNVLREKDMMQDRP